MGVGGHSMQKILDQILDNLIAGQAGVVKELIAEALVAKISPRDILNQGLLSGMSIIGVRFKENQIYVPEVLIAAQAMQAGLEILRPHLATAGVQPAGVAVLGTVKGDLHDIGKNLVGMMLEGAGFKVIDAGVNVAPAKFIQLAKDNQASLIGASALLTTTMINMREIIAAVKAEGLAGQIKVMVGGAPVTQAFADEIGAQGYAPDAASAADLAKQLVG